MLETFIAQGFVCELEEEVKLLLRNIFCNEFVKIERKKKVVVVARLIYFCSSFTLIFFSNNSAARLGAIIIQNYGARHHFNFT